MGEALRKLSSEATLVSELFEPLIGSWAIESHWYGTGAGGRVGEGEWHFERILGGLGVQDVLFQVGSPPREYGTTVRTYDATADVWHIAWMQPAALEFVTLVGRAHGADIVQEGRSMRAGADRIERWRFTGLASNAFTWLGECSIDGGESWHLEQRMDAARMR